MILPTLILALAWHKASCGDVWLNANCTSFLDSAPLVYEEPAIFGKPHLAFRLIVVPAMPGQKALVCFEREHKDTVHCLYNGIDDGDNLLAEYDIWPMAPEKL